MTASQGYGAGVRRALATTGLCFAGVTPVLQFAAFHSSTPPYPHPHLVAATFALHAVVWICVAFRRLPLATVLATWTLVGVTVGAQLVAAGVAHPVAPRNIALTIAAATALLLPLRQALIASAFVSLVTGTALVAAAETPTSTVWSIAVQTPIYSISVAAALGLAFRELRRVARQADDQARNQLAADRTAHRKELAIAAARHRARAVHDTIVNTLGAIATARIASADRLVAQRCAEDARMADVLRRSATPIRPSVRDVLAHATAVDIDLQSDDIAGLERHLSGEPSWRRREIISTLREIVTNIAKHARSPRARMSFDAASATVTISDDGAGMADTARLTEALRLRAGDARAQAQVTSAPGHGTTIALRIPPQNDTATGVFETAAGRMTTAIVAVMLTEFTVIAVVITAFRADWSAPAVVPPIIMWVLVAAVLALLLRNAGRQRTLPVQVVVATYVGLLAMVAIYHLADGAGSVCALKPGLAWAGDAVATIGAVLVLVDGRVRVVLPAMILTAAAVAFTLGDTGSDCVGMTAGLFATDLLVIGAFYILRHQTLRLSTVVATHHHDQIRHREEQERLTADDALNDDGFAATLAFSKEILQAVAERPERAHDPATRAAAGLEEGYLRALIGLTADIATAVTKQRFVSVIDAARTAGVGISVHVAPGVLDDRSADAIVTVVRQIVARCHAGDEVSIGVFGPESAPSLILVAPPHTLAGYPHAAETPPSSAQMTVTAELGLIEMRWFDVAHRSGG